MVHKANIQVKIPVIGGKIMSDGGELLNAEYVGDYTSMAREGEGENYLRGRAFENDSEKSSAVLTPKAHKSKAKMLVFIGRTQNGYFPWHAVAVLSSDMRKNKVTAVTLESGKNRAEVESSLSFSRIYSQYAPSIYWRAFRSLHGYKW